MAIENLKNHLILALLIFNITFLATHTYIYSQKKKALSLSALPSADRSGVITSVNLCDQ